MSYVVRGRVNFSQGQRVRGMGVEQYLTREGIVCYKFFLPTYYPKSSTKTAGVKQVRVDVNPSLIHDKPTILFEGNSLANGDLCVSLPKLSRPFNR